MNDELEMAELLKAVAEENQTRKILALLRSSEDLEAAIDAVTSLLP